MANFITLKKELVSLILQSNEAAKKMGFLSYARDIKELKQMLNKKELLIVTVGEARRGKSTLLNALLNEKEPLFPVDINVCTNVVTDVRYGEKEKVVIFIEDSTAKNGVREEKIDRAEIADYVSETGNPNNYKKIKSLHISLPNPLLKEGVVFVDTPGVGSLNISHAEATYNFLPYADIVLFVSDVGSGYTETELSFMKRSYDYCKNIIFPVTKKDTSADYQTIIDDDIEKITNTLGMPKDEVKIFPVSSTAKIRSLRTGANRMYINSGFKNLEDSIWETVAKSKVELILYPFAEKLMKILVKMKNSIATQYGALTAGNDQIKNLLEEYDKFVKQLKDYQNDGATWKIELGFFFQKHANDTNDEIKKISQQAVELLESRIKKEGSKICKEKRYTKLLMDINDILCKGTLNIKQSTEKAVVEEIENIRNALKLDMDVNMTAIESIEFEKGTMTPIEFEKRKTSQKLIDGGRQIGGKAFGGSTIGGVIGGAIGGIIGTYLGMPVEGAELGAKAGVSLGSVLGGAAGCIDSLKRNPADIHTVRMAISKYITASVSDINKMLSNANLELKKQTTIVLDKEIRNRIEEIQEEMSKIKDNINAAKSDIPIKKGNLEKQSKLVNQLLEKWKELDKKLKDFIEKNQNVQYLTAEQKVVENVQSKEKKKETPTYGFL